MILLQCAPSPCIALRRDKPVICRVMIAMFPLIVCEFCVNDSTFYCAMHDMSDAARGARPKQSSFMRVCRHLDLLWQHAPDLTEAEPQWAYVAAMQGWCGAGKPSSINPNPSKHPLLPRREDVVEVNARMVLVLVASLMVHASARESAAQPEPGGA